MSYPTDLDDVESQQEYVRRSLLSNMPFWLSAIRIAQMLIAFITIVLTRVSVSVFKEDVFRTFGISFLAFVWTAVFMFYIFITPTKAPKLYYYRFHIILELVVTAFWIATVALLAWECQAWDTAEDVVYDSLTPAEAALVNSLPNQWSGVTAFRVALAMATVETLLFATTVFIIRRLLIRSMTEEILN